MVSDRVVGILCVLAGAVAFALAGYVTTRGAVSHRLGVRALWSISGALLGWRFWARGKDL